MPPRRTPRGVKNTRRYLSAGTQRELLVKYNGNTVGVEEAIRQVSYQPAAVRGLPATYSVDSIHLLRMLCCDCLQTVCQRGDGSKLVIFEYGEKHPASVADRPGGMLPGPDQSTIRHKFERHISVVGVRDQAEINNLVAWLK